MKQIAKSKIISIIILLTTFVLIYLYYGGIYRFSANSEELGGAISDYIFNEDVKAEVEFIHKENGWLYVLFTDNRYGNSFQGLARLKRGWNGKYTIFDANYDSGYPVSQYFFADGKGTFAIYGLFPDDRAVRFEYENTGLTSLKQTEYSGIISNKALIQICSNGEPDWMGLHLYDSKGKDITNSYSSTRINGAPKGTTATAESFIVYYSCGFIFVFGFLLAFLFWRSK